MIEPFTRSDITSCYRMEGDGLTFGVAPERMREIVREGSGLLWVDIAAGQDRAVGERLLREIFGFHPLTVDDCYNTLIDPPKVDDYGDYLFIIVHEVHYDAPDEVLWSSELDLYVGRNYVVTLHRYPASSVDEVRRRGEQRSLVLDKGAGFLAHALIDVAVDNFQPVVERLDEQVEAVEERVLVQPERDVLQEVLRLRRNAQRLRRSILPQRDVVNRFARGEYERLVGQASLMYFRDIYDHTVRVDEMIEGVRDQADSALNTYLSSVNNRVNEVMKTLAIVAAIFLPLTLVASIYGTNFENTLPEYGHNAGFVGMIVVMAVIAAGLLWWFRWRRWI